MNYFKNKLNSSLVVLSIGILFTNNAIANKAASTQDYIDLSTFKTAYKQKNYQKVIHDGEHQLKIYSADIDVQLFVGLSYYQLKQYSKAENSFKSVLKIKPSYKEAVIGLTRTDLAQKKYDEAQAVIKKGLSDHPNDPELLTEQAKINELIKVHKNTHPVIRKNSFRPYDSKQKLQNENSSTKLDTSKSIRDIPHFELIGFTSNADVNNPSAIWDWSSLTLYRKNEYGAFGGGVNYANRKGMGTPQLYLNAQPQLNKDLWLDLTYAQANNPSLFPNNTLIGEAYVALGSAFEVSAGEGYRKIQNTYFNTVTGSIGKYLGNYYFSLRPDYFVPKSGPRSLLFTMRARRFDEDNPDKYIGVIISTGTSPDLFDLLTVNFFKVKNNIFLIEGQQPIKDTLAFLYGGGYETQQFPNGFIRRLAYGNIGLKIRFE